MELEIIEPGYGWLLKSTLRSRGTATIVYTLRAMHDHENGVPVNEAELVRGMMASVEDQDIDHAPDRAREAERVRLSGES